MHVRNKSNVMLAELVVVVLFFSLIAVIITQMFVATAQKGKLNGRTQVALMYAQDASELLVEEADPPAILLADGYAESMPGVFEKVTGDGAYRLQVSLSHEQVSPAGTLLTGKVVVSDEKHNDAAEDHLAVLVELPWASYIPRQEVAP